MAILITGVAGFIGSNLARTFLRKGITVYGIDNYCRGTKKNISDLLEHPLFFDTTLDLTDYEELVTQVFSLHKREPIKHVWHLAANSDIPAGVADMQVDYKDTFNTTYCMLRCMKEINIPSFAFASTSAVYGDLGDVWISEDAGPLFPISNYGAMKLASEALVGACVESFLKSAYIFRFPNVIGTPATHGVIMDFIEKLKVSPLKLQVLGNGTQQKVYLHVDELIDAMCFIVENAKEKLNLFNIGSNDEGVTVKFIAESVVAHYSPKAIIEYGLENRGWVGDVPKFKFSTNKLFSLGWKPNLDSKRSIYKAIVEIANQIV